MSIPANQVEIRTLAEALEWGDSMQAALQDRERYIRQLWAIIDGLQIELRVEKMCGDAFAYWWQRQQD